MHAIGLPHRDHPEKQLDLTVARKQQLLHIPVTPTLAADGGGRIGVTLASNAKVARRAARGAGQAVRMAGAEFVRLASIVTGGEGLAKGPPTSVLLCVGIRGLSAWYRHVWHRNSLQT